MGGQSTKTKSCNDWAQFSAQISKCFERNKSKVEIEDKEIVWLIHWNVHTNDI